MTGKIVSHNWDEYFQASEQLFREGQFSALWSRLQVLSESDIPETRRPRYYFYILTCAVYGVGDLDRARDMNRQLDFRFHPTIRYRLCLRLGDYSTARKLRRAHAYNMNELADFRYTLGLHCLLKRKYKFGLDFYQERHRAINTSKSLIESLQYHYLTDSTEEDPNIIVLEQGVGEVLISLLHIRESKQHQALIFCGMPKYRRLVARYFPNATYHSRVDTPELENKPAILALDFLRRSWMKRRSFAVQEVFDTPLRSRHSRPVFGICWRGGSAQNRREERHIALQFFVEFLPKQYDYIVLQYDVSDEEKQFLRAHPNIQIPLLDLTADTLATFDLIRDCAGVISVAGANWHLAGSANVPFLGIMHTNSHWLWGRAADAKSVYSSATTIPKRSLSYDKVSAWAQSAFDAWQLRETIDQPPSIKPADRPVFVTGLPGTGLSNIMQQLGDQGIWIGPDPQNSHYQDHAPQTNNAEAIESYDNQLIRNRLILNILKTLGADQDGITLPPLPTMLPPFPWLRFQIERALREQGWDNNTFWGLKDYRLVLLWPLFARAFPDATWVIVEQNPDKVGLELIQNQRFSRHSTSTEYWKMYLNAFNERINLLRRSGEHIAIVKAEEEPSSIRTLVDSIIHSANTD